LSLLNDLPGEMISYSRKTDRYTSLLTAQKKKLAVGVRKTIGACHWTEVPASFIRELCQNNANR